MILYNVTVQVDHSVKHDWIRWMQDVHIPDVLKTGLFTGYRLCRLLNDEHSAHGITYAVQYYLRTLEDLQHYQQNHAPRLQAEHASRYGDQCLAFRTILEVIDEQT